MPPRTRFFGRAGVPIVLLTAAAWVAACSSDILHSTSWTTRCDSDPDAPGCGVGPSSSVAVSASSAGGAGGEGGVGGDGGAGARGLGGAGGESCDTCSDKIGLQPGSGALCPDSEAPYNALRQCVCTKCTSDCIDVCTKMSMATAACTACAQAQCNPELQACLNDNGGTGGAGVGGGG